MVERTTNKRETTKQISAIYDVILMTYKCLRWYINSFSLKSISFFFIPSNIYSLYFPRPLTKHHFIYISIFHQISPSAFIGKQYPWTVTYTLHITHCTLDSVHYTMHTKHRKLHTTTLHTERWILHTTHCKPKLQSTCNNLFSAPRTLPCEQCTIHTEGCTVHTEGYTVHTEDYKVHTED